MADQNPFIPAPATPGGEVLQQDLDRAALENAGQQQPIAPVDPSALNLEGIQAPIEPALPPVEEIPVEPEALTPIEEKIQVAQVPSDEEIEEESRPIRKEMAAVEAAKNVEQEAINKAYDGREQALLELQQAYKSAEKIDPNRYFKNQSTGDKIQSAIGLFLMGLGGNANAGLAMVRQQVDRDVQAQQLNKQETIKRTAVSLKLAENELDRLGALTKNKDRLAKVQAMKQQLQLAQNQEVDKLQKAKRFASPKGFSTEELYALPDSQVKKAVRFPDGRFRLATNAVLAKKLNEETIPSSINALESIKQLKNLAQQSAGGSLSLESRRSAKTLVQSLVGNLRLELFGPGVLTDTEQKIARDIIGNPTKLFSLSSLELTALETLEAKLKYSINTRVRQSVPSAPGSKNEKMIKILRSKNKGLSKAKAINALRKIGKWDADETF